MTCCLNELNVSLICSLDDQRQIFLVDLGHKIIHGRVTKGRGLHELKSVMQVLQVLFIIYTTIIIEQILASLPAELM